MMELESQLFKITSGEVVKYISFNPNTKNYKDFILAGVQKLQLGLEYAENITLQDQDGTLIEEDIFQEYLKIIGHSSTIKFVVDHVPEQPEEIELADINDSVDLQGIEIIEVSSIHPSFEIDDVIEARASTSSQTQQQVDTHSFRGLDKEELESFLRSNTAAERIFWEYDAKSTLTNQARRLLVNFVVTLLTNKYGKHPSKEQKVTAAKAVVQLFPNLKDHGTPEGYETFYDPISRNGWIEWRLKTINKVDKLASADKQLGQGESKKKKSKPNPPVEQAEINFDEQEKHKKWLLHASIEQQRAEIFEKMKETFPLRQKEIRDKSINIIKAYPRFLDDSDLSQGQETQDITQVTIKSEIEDLNCDTLVTEDEAKKLAACQQMFLASGNIDGQDAAPLMTLASIPPLAEIQPSIPSGSQINTGFLQQNFKRKRPSAEDPERQPTPPNTTLQPAPTSTTPTTVPPPTPVTSLNNPPNHSGREDECDLFCKLLAIKLRRLPEEDRQLIMYEIDGLFINRLRCLSLPDNTPSSTPPPS